MTFSDFGCHTNNLFIQHEILKVCEIIKLHQMQLVYSFLDNELPSDLRKLFILNDEIHTHHTRQVFHVPRADTSMYGINSLEFLCPNLWNNTWKNGVASNENDVVTFENVRTIHQFKSEKHYIYSYSLNKHP